MFITDPDLFFYPSRIPNPGVKNLARYFCENNLNIYVDEQLTLMEAYWIHFSLD
jgi:hypothetical protein